MPCPWYRGGVCTSPLLESPSPDPVIPSICLSDDSYVRCRYYVEPRGREVRGFSGRFGKPLLLIHSISRLPRSNCEFFIVEKHESGAYLAACEVLRRYLTRYEVRLCEEYWRDCPYRRIGRRLSLGTT